LAATAAWEASATTAATEAWEWCWSAPTGVAEDVRHVGVEELAQEVAVGVGLRGGVADAVDQLDGRLGRGDAVEGGHGLAEGQRLRVDAVEQLISLMDDAVEPLQRRLQLLRSVASEHRVGGPVEGVDVADLAPQRILVCRQGAGHAVEVVDHPGEVVAAASQLVGGGAEVDQDAV